jgi:hypothetical protein
MKVSEGSPAAALFPIRAWGEDMRTFGRRKPVLVINLPVD